MKKYAVLAILYIFNMHGIYEYYHPTNNIVVCATDEQSKDILVKVLQKCGLQYNIADTLDAIDPNVLYIFAGDSNLFNMPNLPLHYIVYQTKLLSKINEENLRLWTGATAIWDAHWDNINKYSHRIRHWYYLPNEQYEFLDPVILPCFLPYNALSHYKELLSHSNITNTDFSSHIPVLFAHAVLQNPSIMIESGIRWGNGSTISFSRALNVLDAYLIGLDIDNCSKHYNELHNAQFIQMSDVLFPAYFKTMHLKNDTVDLVFIDTSHQYEHTLQEIDAFSEILSDNGVFIFHDSNVAIPRPVRINGTVCPTGMGNPKGVTDGLKTYFGFSFDEGTYINVYVEKAGYLWNIINYPYCYGLAVAKRIQKSN